MKLTVETTARELKKLAVYYPAAKRSMAELVILTEMFLEDLGHLSNDAFCDAIKAHRQRSEFFPTAKNLLDRHRDLTRKPKEFIPLPEPDLSPEQAKAHKQWIRNLRVVKSV